MRFCATPEEAIAELKKFGCDEDTLANFRNYMRERRSLQSPPKWHPIVDLPFFRERMASLDLNQDTPFLSGDAHRRFREVIQEFRIHKWGCPMRPVLEASSSLSSAVASSNSNPLAQVEHAIASAIVGATATSNDRDSTTHNIAEVVTAPKKNALEPHAPRAILQLPPGSCNPCATSPNPPVPERGSNMPDLSAELAPCGGTRGRSQEKSEQKITATTSAQRASASAHRNGCVTGIARMLQRVICCADVSRKSLAA